MDDPKVRRVSLEQPPANRAPDVVVQTVDADGLAPVYANFVRVAGTPEELVLDFGLNTQPTAAHTNPIKITERVVLNHYTAKRMWLALGAALQRHEQIFGALEIDVNKRVSPAAKQ